MLEDCAGDLGGLRGDSLSGDGDLLGDDALLSTATSSADGRGEVERGLRGIEMKSSTHGWVI